MNVLIVDDDRFVVTSLERKISWSSLSIDQVYTAYNIRQAQKILMESSIHILISDIDMPQGSGLELLAWLRSENYDVQTIFLTNHADFNYAQKAIELQSFEYYLKPIEFDKLTLIIKKAIQQVRSIQKAKQAALAGHLWEQSKDKLIEHFWLTCIKNTETFSQDELTSHLVKNHLPYKADDQFLMILFSFFSHSLSSHNEVISARESNGEFEQIFADNFHSIFSDNRLSYDMLLEFGVAKDQYIAIFKISKLIYNDVLVNLELSCKRLISEVQTNLSCALRCDVGTPCTFDTFHTVLSQLQMMNEDIIDCQNRIFHLKCYHPIVSEYKLPNLELLEHHLQSGNRTGFINKCHQYLISLSEKNCLNLNNLCCFRIDVTQLIYTFLKKNEILAHKLLKGKTNELLLEHSSKSLEDILIYLSYLVNTSLDYIEFSTSQKSVTKTICEYINSNYNQDITRSSLAEIVYLNPDHTARIFKKEIGVSLGNYIIQTRISIAKDLLSKTDLAVNIVADKVGYGNYSYFTKLFKKETNYTPIDYRKMMKAYALKNR